MENFMGVSITVILFTAVGFLAMVVGLVASRKHAAQLTGAATVLAALGGFFTYGYGFSRQIEFMPLAVVRAVQASLGMFMGRNDFSAVSGTPIFSHPTAQVFFWLVHLFALYATASAALTTIGAGALRRLRLLLIYRGNLDIIYGVDGDSVSFGKKLVEQQGRRAVVFVDHSAAPGLAGEISGMGAVLFTATTAVSPNLSFLRNVGMRPNRQLTLYAMQKDPARNLQYAETLLKALQEKEIPCERTSLVLFCAEETDAGVFQALNDSYGYGSVAAFDAAGLAARVLVREYPPCDAISFGPDGRAVQNFEALLVGFGQVGQAVLRQLVMNGQFEGSAFRLTVFAPDCSQVNGCLTNYSRELTAQYSIDFQPYDGRSREMYQYLFQHRSTLRYIVVCTGNERLNQEIADELTRYLGHLGAEAAVYQCSYQGVVRQSGAGRPAVRKGIYTPELLCTNALDRMAIALNQCYCEGNGRTASENWTSCDYFSRNSSRASADFIPALIRAAGRSAEQVLAGDWTLTEEQLENLSRTEHLRWCAFHYVMGFEPMSREIYAERCARYRAEKEEFGKSSLRIGKDMEAHRHACLIPWEELDALSEAENAVTGGNVDYKAMDRNNVLILPKVWKAGQAE
ncbi:MAG: hypothetical protein NC432_12730 [Roseburia sp.]|nr:hypothetical protein [Roseburia sp.]MCM1097439.1 hypothetical protein [Ruminococcus flavefaciens]